MKPVAGIVAYNPGRSLVELCAALQAQGCQVFIHDNGSTAGTSFLDDCADLGASVCRAQTNTGVAGGLSSLLSQVGSADWLLTFDQDSEIGPGFVAALAESEAVGHAQVAIIAPRVVETASGATVQGRADSASWHSVRRVITSGALCRVAALNAVGGFRDDLFIDYVDYDLCLRLSRQGWQIVIEPTAVLNHTIGAQTTGRVLGLIPVETSNHSPDRQYYKYRNYVLLCRDRTLWADPSAAIWDGLALAWGPIKILLLEQHKRAKLAAIASGVAHGLVGRSGRRS